MGQRHRHPDVGVMPPNLLTAFSLVDHGAFTGGQQLVQSDGLVHFIAQLHHKRHSDIPERGANGTIACQLD